MRTLPPCWPSKHDHGGSSGLAAVYCTTDNVAGQLRTGTADRHLSRQSDNVRFQQSRNVLLISVKLDGWKNRRC